MTRHAKIMYRIKSSCCQVKICLPLGNTSTRSKGAGTLHSLHLNHVPSPIESPRKQPETLCPHWWPKTFLWQKTSHFSRAEQLKGFHSPVVSAIALHEGEGAPRKKRRFSTASWRKFNGGLNKLIVNDQYSNEEKHVCYVQAIWVGIA